MAKARYFSAAIQVLGNRGASEYVKTITTTDDQYAFYLFQLSQKRRHFRTTPAFPSYSDPIKSCKLDLAFTKPKFWLRLLTLPSWSKQLGPRNS
jgi:hypothetical protein